MRDVSQKIRRLLYIVPYVAKYPEGVPVDQLAKMLGAERTITRSKTSELRVDSRRSPRHIPGSMICGTRSPSAG